MYYDYNKILSYNAFINFLHGERGVGKTYGASKFVVKQFEKNKDEFAYIRRFKTELKEAVPNFFAPLIDNNEFQGHTLKTKNSKFYYDDEICGHALTLTTAQNLKSSNFNKVKNIIFDEYLIEEGQHYYLRNEVENFLGLIETIARMRDVRIFMLANAVTVTNPYFLYFDLSLPYNNDIKTFKDGLILVQYMKNEEYREAKRQTKFGKLIQGTGFEKYAIDNQFMLDNKNFIQKKTGTSKFSFAFIYKDEIFGIWFDYSEGKIFVSNDYDKNTPYMFSTTLKDHSENTMFINSAKKYNCWKNFIENFKLGNVRFENMKIKNITQELIKMLLKH